MSNKWFGKKRVDAGDLAEMLGEALDQAFERHLPSPQEIADSIAKAIENANFSTAEQMGKVKAAYVENQNVLTDKWNEVIAQLQATQKATEELPAAMQQVLSSETEKWKECTASIGEQVKNVPEAFATVTEASQKQVEENFNQLTAAFTQATEGTQKQMGEMFQQLSTSFADQVSQIKSTTEKLSADLQKIGEVGEGIEKLLRVQESVDGLMKQVTAADEMKKAFEGLQANLDANNKYLEAASQPRIVRLVEGEE